MDNYWDDRAKHEYTYKNDKFYTITPIPYYYARREVVLKLLKKNVANPACRTVADYGCGDGEYIKKLYEKNCMSKWYGYDISEEMIKSAKKLDLDVDYCLASEGISNTMQFDLIYTVAVLAHVNDDVVDGILSNFHDHLTLNGHIILCEQVGKRRTEGTTYTRRTVEEYEKIARQHHLIVEKQYLIDFWMHRRVFERHIAKWFYKQIEGESETAKRLRANGLPIFRILSKIFVVLSIPYLFYKKTGWGYMFLVLKK